MEPLKLAIFYGWPSTVNGTNNVTDAANIYSAYNIVTFGDGLQNTSHPDYQNTLNIINQPSMTNVAVYGYVDCTQSLNTIKSKIDKWAVMNIAGIMCDPFGYDFNVSRNKQNNIVNYIHGKGLSAFVNTWNPDDAFSPNIDPNYNPNGLSCNLGPNDWYLAESYQIITGNYQNVNDWTSKSEKMANYRNIFGTKMACLTTYDLSTFDQQKADYSYYSCILYGFDAWGWGEENFSATSSLLPYRNRKPLPPAGNMFTGPVINNGDIHQRKLNVGIKINTLTNSSSELL